MTNNFNKFNLDKNIIKALDKLEYKRPTNVQSMVIPKLIQNKNIVVKSKTGSGKTASFSIPLCESIKINNTIQALVVVPTRELALQVDKEISNIGRIKTVRSSAIFGKQPIKEQISTLKQRVHIVVATSGRIIDHIQRGTINLENLKYLIIDEADKMLNKGFVEQMDTIFKSIPKEATIGLFSATVDESIKSVCDRYINDYEIIEIEDEIKSSKNINEKIIKVGEHEKYDTLKNIIYSENPDSVIVFLNTKEKVSSIYRKLKSDGFLVRELSGDMSQEKRIFTIKDFTSKKFNVLVSTDVASRGIHIDNISLVINYDVVRDRENYVHRIGRTGRYDKFGKAITIVTTKDEKYLGEIQDYIGYEIEEINDIDIKDIESNKLKFLEKSKQLQKQRHIKRVNTPKNEEVTRLYLNAGKKKKIRAVDIVGTLNSINDINNEDIGVIDIRDLCSYVDILNYKGSIILDKYKELNIKRKSVKVKRDNQID